jgi:hypothetical protein
VSSTPGPAAGYPTESSPTGHIGVGQGVPGGLGISGKEAFSKDGDGDSGSGSITNEVKPAKISPVPTDAPLPQIEKLAEIASQANSEVPRILPSWLRGIIVHVIFANYVRALGPGSGFAAEQSYINGRPERYGLSGTVRADAIYGPVERPIFAVDLKTGGAYLTQGQADRYEKHLPPGTEYAKPLANDQTGSIIGRGMKVKAISNQLTTDQIAALNASERFNPTLRIRACQPQDHRNPPAEVRLPVLPGSD